jgi:P-type Ca2+ transporter type 2C
VVFRIEDLPGLTEAEAADRLRREGPNELPSAKPRSLWRIGLGVLAEPMILLLLVCGSVYFFLGDTAQAVLLLASIAAILSISFVQERKAERALEALRDLSSPRALVLREGRQRRVAGREVVRGDLAVVGEGDRIPADGVALWSVNLTVDESLLTGESAPVRKVAGDESLLMKRPGDDPSPCVYSGTLAVGGRAVIRVLAAGASTEIGRIGKSLSELGEEKTLLQKETGRAVWIFAGVGLVICLAIFFLYAKTRGSWLGGALAGLTTAMSLLPEEFPVVLTLFLAMGAWRISRRRVLTRRIPALENLGAIGVLCVDKTGTITMNRMSVAALDDGTKVFDIKDPSPADLPEDYHRVLEYGVLASHRDPFDPMERAILDCAKATLSGTEHLHQDWELIREYPLKPELLAMSCVWKARKGEDFRIGTKGAPEAVMDLCHFDAERTEFWMKRVQALADRGFRVLAVAHSVFQETKKLPPHQHDFDFEFMGLVALEDPVRPGVPEAVAECDAAGVRVLMITGDYPGTARRIGGSIGLPTENGVLTGEDLETMSSDDLRSRLQSASLVARAAPEQKLRIVAALKAAGETVAMTGDGVNDAPALKASDVGIAMGQRGTDVAREAADIVLLDDDFSSIVAAIRLGRRIYDNIRKAMSYLVAIHVPIAGMSLLPVLLGMPLALFPVHIVFLELIIDPACSLVFEEEPEAADVMHRPPRPANQPLFSRRMVSFSLLQGLTALAAVFGIFACGRAWGWSDGASRAQSFITLIFANLGLIFANRSRRNKTGSFPAVGNRVIVWVAFGAVFFLILAVTWPFLRHVFGFDGFESLAPWLPFLAALAGLASALWTRVFNA